jgi:hypothetical protein
MFARKQKFSDKEIQSKYGVSADMLQYRLRMSGVDFQMNRAKAKWRI